MSRTRRTATAALVLTSAGALLVATATPGAAGGGSDTVRHAAVWTFDTGAVSGTVGSASGAALVDQSRYDDKVNAVPAAPDVVAVNGVACAYGSAYASGLSVWGAGQWASKPVGTTIGVRLQLSCVNAAGVLHRFNWGTERLANGSYVKDSSNCVQLYRASTYSYTLTADEKCPAQDEILDPKPSKQLSATPGHVMPFTSTITLTATAP